MPWHPAGHVLPLFETVHYSAALLPQRLFSVAAKHWQLGQPRQWSQKKSCTYGFVLRNFAAMVQKIHHSMGVVRKMVFLIVVRQVLQIVWASCESNFGYHFGRHLFDVVDGIFRVGC